MTMYCNAVASDGDIRWGALVKRVKDRRGMGVAEWMTTGDDGLVEKNLTTRVMRMRKKAGKRTIKDEDES